MNTLLPKHYILLLSHDKHGPLIYMIVQLIYMIVQLMMPYCVHEECAVGHA